MIRPGVWDASPDSVVVGCSPPCTWRTVAATELTAMRAWAEHRTTSHTARPGLGTRSRARPRHTTCVLCAGTEQVEPFAGYCRRCRLAQRAAKARATYQQGKAS